MNGNPNWKLLICALIGHKKTRCVWAKLEIPYAEKFKAVICFRCDHIHEDELGTALEYAPHMHEPELKVY